MSKKTEEDVKQKMDEYYKTHGAYCNWINFSDDILSDYTIKELLSRWISIILYDVRYAISKYYDAKDIMSEEGESDARIFFRETNNKIKYLTPILEDMVHKNIYGIEDMVIAIYGVVSDEVYIIRHFLHLSNKKWDRDYMTQSSMPNRLKNILY